MRYSPTWPSGKERTKGPKDWIGDHENMEDSVVKFLPKQKAKVDGGWGRRVGSPTVLLSHEYLVYVAKDRIETSHPNGALVVAHSPLVEKRKGQGIATLIEGTGQSENIGT